MTNFLIIRHGQSRANLDETFAGHTDAPLSDLGRAQVQRTAEYIVSHFRVDRVYASDLHRAFDTAKAVADRLGMPVIAEPDLREIFAGEWEGVPFDALHARGGEPWRIWIGDIGRAVCPGGESVAQLQARVVAALRRIARENEGKTVVIGTHATPIRVLQCHCLGLPPEEMKNLRWVPNASVTTVLAEGDRLMLESAGYADHLGIMRTALPTNV